MDTSNIVDFASRDGISDGPTDLLRTGAQQLIASAVEAELEGFLAQFATARTAAGHAAVKVDIGRPRYRALRCGAASRLRAEGGRAKVRINAASEQPKKPSCLP